MEDLLGEMEEIEQTPGLIRPILLNMVGLLLDRLVNRDRERMVKARAVNGFVRAYLRYSLADPSAGADSRAILQHMIKEGEP